MLNIIINIITAVVLIISCIIYIKISFYKSQDKHFRKISSYLEDYTQNTNANRVLSLLITFNLSKLSLHLLKKFVNSKRFSLRKEYQYTIYHWIMNQSKSNNNLYSKLKRLNKLNLILTLIPILFIMLSYQNTNPLSMAFILSSLIVLQGSFYYNLHIINDFKELYNNLDYYVYLRQMPLLYIQFIGSNHNKEIYTKLKSLATSFYFKDKTLFMECVANYLEVISLHILSFNNDDFDNITIKFLNYIEDIPNSILIKKPKIESKEKHITELSDDFILSLKKIKEESY